MAEPWKEFGGGGGAGGPWNDFAAPATPQPAKSKLQRPDRSWGTAVTDTGRSLASGVGTVVEGLGSLGGMVTGNMDNSVAEFGRSVQDYWRDGQSDALKFDREQRQAEMDAAEGIAGKAFAGAKATLTRPGLLVDTIAETAASMLPAGAAGRVGALAAGGRALARGATPAQAATHAGRVGTAAAIGTGSLQAAADVGGGVYAGAMEQDDEAWSRNPAYLQRVAAGEDPGAVRHDLALTASRAAAAATSPLSIASQFIPGGATIERLTAGAALRPGLAGGVVGRAASAARGMVGEAAQEAIEEGGGQFLGNVASRAYVDPEQDLSEGVGEAAGIASVAGGGLGGVAGAVAPRRPTLQRQAAPGSLEDAANTAAPPPAPVGPTGPTLDVNAAPNAPTLRYPNAQPGSMADAANAIPEAPAAPAAAGPDAGMFNRILAEQGRASSRSVARGDEAGNAAYEDRDTSTGVPEPTAPPINLDPQTGEELGIDAGAWPAAAEHQQPAAIVQALKAAAARNKNRPDGVTRIAETYNVSKDTARALRNRAIAEMQAEAGSPRRADGSTAEAAAKAGEAAVATPQARDSMTGPGTETADTSPPQDTPLPQLVDEEGRPNRTAIMEFRKQHGADAARAVQQAQSNGEPITLREALAKQDVARTERKAEVDRQNSPEGRAAEQKRLKEKADAESVERKAHFNESTGGALQDGDYETETGLKYRVVTGKDRAGKVRQAIQTIDADGEFKPVGVIVDGVPDQESVAWASGFRDGYLRSTTPATAAGPTTTSESAPDADAQPQARAELASAPAAREAAAVEGEAGAQGRAEVERAQDTSAAAEQGVEAGAVSGIETGAPQDQGTHRTERDDAQLREPRVEQDPDLQGMAERGGPLPEPEQSLTPQLRRQGDNAAPAVGAALSGVPGGSGREAEPGSHTGEDQQRPGLPAGQRPVGDAQGTGQQPAEDALADVQRRDEVADGLGGADRAGAFDAAVPAQPGENVSGGSPDNATSVRAPIVGSPIRTAASEAATSPDNELRAPTDAQLEAGNFKVGRARINGHEISIEHPAGVKRKASHRKKLRHAYGYIRRTEGADGEKVDVFLSDRAADTTLPVFVVDQTKADGGFDESKVMMGFDSEAGARAAYLANYPKGWTGLGAITEMSQDEFKAWVRDPKRTRKPAGKLAKPAPAQPDAEADPRVPVPMVREGFDGLFDAIQHEDTAEGNVRLFSKAPTDETTDSTFFSALLRAVETAKGAPRRGGALAWKQWLDGAQRRGELKQEERDWLGVDAWLEGQESITREQVIDYVRANQVQVQEVELGDPAAATAQRHADVMALFDRKHPEATVEAREDAAYDTQEWLNGSIETSDLARALGLELDALREVKKRGGGAKFGDYQLPGGTNYRELLLTLPVELDPADVAEVRALAAAGKWEDAARKEANARRRASFINKTHYDRPNIVAHVRFNERTDADGKRVLFLEEVQSDWHQRGRRDGYRGQERPEGASKVWKEVPDAPFKTSWPMLTFRRMLRYAADHGYERIAWTTGQQQFDRYPEGSDEAKAARLNGMEGFYDRVLPNEVNKLVKRFGGKVGRTRVPTSSQFAETFDPRAAEVLDRGGAFQVWVNGRLHGGNFDSREAAESFAQSGGGTAVHSVDITPDLRRAALGGQPLFSATRGAQGSAPLTFDRALQLKARITGEWGANAPVVHVVQSVADLPAEVSRNPSARGAEGVFLGTRRGAVWVVAGNIPTEKRFAEVLVHEALGHFGVESIIGQAEWTGIVAAITNHARNKTGAASVRRAIVQVQARPDSKELSDTDFAKEVVAVMAEQGAKNGLVARVVAAVRAWLRKHVPDLKWTDADVIGLLAQADSFLRAGRTQAESRQAVAAAAFSQRQALSAFLRGEAVGEAGREAFPRQEGITLLEQVEAYFAEIGGEATNPQIGVVRMRRPGIKASIAHGIGRPKAAAFRLVPDVIQNGRVIDQRIDESGRSVNRHVIAAPVRIEGRDYLMGVVVRQQGGDPANFYVHEVTLTPKEEPRQSIETEPRAEQADIGGPAGAIATLLLDAYAGNRDSQFSMPPVQVAMDGRGNRTLQMGGETFLEVGRRFYMVDGNGRPKDFTNTGAANEAAKLTGGEVLFNDPIEGQRPSWSVVVPDVVTRAAGAARPLFSKAQTEAETSEHGPDPDRAFAPTVDFDALRREKAPLSSYVQGGLDWLKAKAWLPMVPLNYLVDYAQKGQTQVHEFMRIRGMMDSYRGEQHGKYSESQQTWLKLVSKDKKDAAAMADVMHDSTLWQVDPSLEESEPLTFHYGSQTLPATPENVKKAVKEIRKQIRGRAGDDKSKFYEEINKVEAMGVAEAKRPSRHAILRKRFLALSPEAQAMYVEAKDAYKQSIQEWDAVVLENVEQEMALAEARADREFEKKQQELRDTLAGDELTKALNAASNHHARATSDRAKANATLLQQMRQDFESARMQGPYFPLARFGEYFAAVRNAAGELLRFDMFESSGERDHFVKQIQADPNGSGLKIRTGMTSNKDEVRGAVDAGFMLEIEQALSEHGATATLKDAVWQRYLATLPGLSQRKHFIHRKGTPGYSAEAMRAYGDHMFHLAHQIAKLRYGPQLRQAVELAREEAANPLQGAAQEWAETAVEKRESILQAVGDEFDAKQREQLANGHFASLPEAVKTRFLDSMTQEQRERARKADALYDSTQADMLVNELEHRLEWVLNPRGGSTAQKITSFAFLWNLAISPAAALVNWTQTPMLGIPILGAHLGGATKAAKALTRASAELARSKRLHLSNSLTGNEKRAFDEFLVRGLLDRTYSQLLAGVGDTGVKYSALREKWMGRAAFLFHNMERINRETTALAAYRMAVDKGMNHAQAVDEAVRLTHMVHFDMTNSARARALQSDAAKVLMVHRSHSLNLTYRMLRDLKQMLRGTTPEERSIARQQFVGIMGMHALLAGVAGVPFYGIAMMAAGVLKDAFGDDDDERTPEDLLKKWLYDAMPKEWADLVLYGAPSKATQASLYNRIGFPDFFFRDPNGEMEGKSEAEFYINQFLGPAFAIPTQVWTGINHIGKGNLGRGVESLLPKGVRDVIKAGRYANEGVLTLGGDPVVDEVNAWELIGQAAGFSPFKVSEAYEQRKSKKGLETRILQRRSSAMNRYMLGVRQGDPQMMDEALQDIAAFNQAYPEKAITRSGLRQSVRARLLRSERAGVAGMVLDKKLEPRIQLELGY